LKIDRDRGAYLRIAGGRTDRNLIWEIHHLKEKRFLRGIHLEKTFRRSYPHGDLLGHVLGFVNHKGRGVSGIEAFADSFLRGVDGSRVFRKDGIQNEIYSSLAATTDGYPGGCISLTLDGTIQFFAESELREMERRYSPKWAAAVVLDPRTGHILAAASVPSLDPADPATGRNGHWINNVFQTEYLPGSSFKPLFMALALDNGTVDLDRALDCQNGKWKVGGRIITDVHGGFGLLTPAEILVKSSNIGMARIALGMVPEETPRGGQAFRPVYNHLRLMGLGRKPGVLLESEESPGRLSPLERWSRIYTLVSVSFGYEMTVTPIQMAAAFMTIANSGLYLPPRLIESYSSGCGKVVRAPRAPACRVFSRESSIEIAHMLVRSVEEGTGRPARIPGCAVAGKTGTAMKDQNRDETTASFVAFAPADDPALLVLVVVDEPHAPSVFGSRVAAPHVRNILEKGLAHLGTGVAAKLVCAEKGRTGNDSP